MLKNCPKNCLKPAEQRKKLENGVWMTRIYNSCSSCKVNQDKPPWLINEIMKHQHRASSFITPKPLLCLSVSLGTTNRIAPQFRRFSLLCFCEMKEGETFKLNFTLICLHIVDGVAMNHRHGALQGGKVSSYKTPLSPNISS